MAAQPGGPMSGADIMRISGFLGEGGGGGAEAGGGGGTFSPSDISPVGLTEAELLNHKLGNMEWSTFQELFGMFENGIAQQNLVDLADGCTTFFMFLPNRRGFTLNLTTHNLTIKQSRFLTTKVSTLFSRPQGG